MQTESQNKTEISPADSAMIVVPAHGGTVLNAFDNTVQIKLSGEQTNGTLTFFQASIPPGSGPPPHMHHEEDELFLIQEGQFRFLKDGQWTEAMGAGTLVYTPRGVVHTFQNAGDTTGSFWGTATPSSFEQFFARCGNVFAQPGPPDIARIVEISTEYGIEYVPSLTGTPHALETASSASTIVVAAHEGTRINAFGDAAQIKLSGEQTNGSLVAFVDTVPPGGGPPPHTHHGEDEVFLILDGQFRFLVNGQWTEAMEAGTVVYAPRNVVHTFQNAADTPSRFLGLTTASGFDRFFARCADVFAQPGPPDIARIVAISTEHGIEYVPPILSTVPASA